MIKAMFNSIFGKKDTGEHGDIAEAVKQIVENGNGAKVETEAPVPVKTAKPGKDFDIIGLKDEQKVIEMAVEHNFPVLIKGETGVGKTYMLQNFARRSNNHIVRISLNGEIGINELLGKWLIKNSNTYWQDGVLVDAMRRGHWVVLDEINVALPEVLFCLNSLLDDSKGIVIAEKDGEFVKAHKNFRLFATMNPSDEYAGTKEMNKALLSRFPIVMSFRGYNPKTELKILKYHSGINDELGRVIIDVANDIRKLKEDKELWYFCSTRDIVNWARLVTANGHSLQEAFELSVLNKCEDDTERSQILDVAKKAPAIEVNWKKKADQFKKLTADIENDIKKLNKKKAKLLDFISQMENQINNMKGEIQE